MSNQTMQRSTTKRRASAKNTARAGSFSKQTARLEGRRDGKPLLFGWGTHLTRAQKTRIQRRAAYSFAGVVFVLIIAVIIFGLLQQNVLIPNETIVKVNGVNISQDQYRRFLDYNAQTTWNRIQSELKQQGQLLPKVNAGDATATNQNQILTSDIQTDEANYQQSTITQATIQLMIEDQLIRQAEKQFPTAKIEPTAQDITTQINAFKASFPAGESYAQFLQKDSLSNADVRTAVAVQMRRDNLQKYLSSQLVSPTRQVHIRFIQTNQQSTAKTIFAAIHKDPSTANWTTLAKQYSLDTNSKNSGGDQGWVPPGTGDAAIGNWAYDSSRKINDISGIITDTNGTFDIVQLMGVDPSRTVDKNTLSAAQSNALAHWLGGQKVATGVHVSSPDQNMLTDSRNMPVMPDLNASLPVESTPPASTGATG